MITSIRQPENKLMPKGKDVDTKSTNTKKPKKK